MPSACLIGRITVKNADKWAEYRSKVPVTLAPWGAELLFRGTQSASYAGDDPHRDIVVIRFPDQASIDGWHGSAAYQALLPIRAQAADVVLIAYQN